MRVVPLEAFRDKISFAVGIGAVERGFRALGLGEATLPDPMVLELPEQAAEVHVKGAHLRGGRHIVLKLATGFNRNRARGLPSGDGMFLLLDADTGVPDILLEEHGYLTDFRTAAAVALTLKYLAPKRCREALLVGAGALARLTARARPVPCSPSCHSSGSPCGTARPSGLRRSRGS
jgi:ornithine cyclodeaminase/alanine dehydrogenase-like protein (mu-crystallin family)